MWRFLLCLLLLLVSLGRGDDNFDVYVIHRPSTAEQIVQFVDGGLSPVWRQILLSTSPFDGDVVTQAILAVNFAHQISNTVTRMTPCDAFARACDMTIDHILEQKFPVTMVDAVHKSDCTRIRSTCDDLRPDPPTMDDRVILKHMTRLSIMRF